ncbi:MAG: type 1 glutamine amidotransferase [Leptospirales bacterium]|nr:type 1 glutamine amidotransferase [Leptospirales bacterium]
MKILCLQHVPFEEPGLISRWAENNHHSISSVHVYREPLPESQDFDRLVVMGGPMSANDEGTLAWLRPEKQFLGKAIESGKSVIGVCLGAQLIASVAGAMVYKNQEKEIGWYPVRFNETATARFKGLPSELSVLHWHGETFDLPSGATLLAQSTACENQAFLLGDRVLGLQFHLEVMADNVDQLLWNCPNDLTRDPWVQNASQIQSGLVHTTGCARALNLILDQLG